MDGLDNYLMGRTYGYDEDYDESVEADPDRAHDAQVNIRYEENNEKTQIKR